MLIKLFLYLTAKIGINSQFLILRCQATSRASFGQWMLEMTEEMSLSPESRKSSARLLSAYLALFLVIWSLRATLFFALDERIHEPLWKEIYSNFLKLILWVIPPFFYSRLTRTSAPWQRWKVSSGVNVPGLVCAVGVSGLYFAGLIIINHFVLGKNMEPLFQTPPRVFAGALAAASVSALLEEIFLRGFVLNEMQRTLSFGKANCATSVLFVLVHWPHWLWTQGLSASFFLNSLSIFLLGLLLGCLVKWSNSLWLAAFAHALNNAIASF